MKTEVTNIRVVDKPIPKDLVIFIIIELIAILGSSWLYMMWMPWRSLVVAEMLLILLLLNILIYLNSFPAISTAKGFGS